MMLITLKTFQKISNLAHYCNYDSTRGAIDHVLGNSPTDLSDIPEDQATKVVVFLSAQLEQKKKDKNYQAPKPVEAKGNGKSRAKFGLEDKKKKTVFIVE